MKLTPLLITLLGTQTLAFASNVTWDSNTTTTGAQDGAGTWNTANTNWWNGSANVSFVAGDNVTFGAASGAAGTINVDAGGVTVGTLTFNQAGSSSYTFTGGSITGTALTKSGTNGLRFDNANTFTTVSASAGPYSQTDGAFRLGNANALGTAPITFTNAANMTGLYFLTGFGTATTFSNDITFTSSTVTTRLVTTAGLNLPTGQIVTLSGVLSGGSATSIIQTDNSAGAGVSRIKVTNASNTVQLQHWNLNRGGLEFTSDAALGNTSNGLRLDVTNAAAGTGLIFGADNIAITSTRAVTVQSATVIDTQAFTGSQINGAVTMTGLIYKQGSTDLTFNGTGTGTGGIRIDGGSVQVGTGGTTGTIGTGAVTFNATGTNLTFNRSDALSFSGGITGSGSVTKKGAGTLTLSGTNSYSAGTTVDAGVVSIGAASNIGSGSIAFSAIGTGLTLTGTAVTLANNISLPTSGSGNVTLLTPNNSATVINGNISGGGTGTVLFFQGGATSQNTGALTLNGTNTFAGAINIQRGPLILGNASAAGTAKIIIDSNNPASGALQLGNFSIANNLVLTGAASVGVASGNFATIAGVISQTAATPLVKVGTGSLTLSGNNTYAGGTTVNAGTLVAGSTTAFGSGNVTVNSSAILDLNGVSVANQITSNGGSIVGSSGSASISQSGGSLSGSIGGTITASGSVAGSPTITGTLKGTATFTGAVVIANGAFHAPGNSPGLETFDAGITYDASSTLQWEFVGDDLSVRGTDYDGVDVTGGDLSIVAGASLALIASSVDYSATQWDSVRVFSVVSFTSGGAGTGNFLLDTSAAGTFASEGAWSVANTGGSSVLTWTPVPEPSAYAALAGLVGLGLVLRRRSRRA